MMILSIIPHYDNNKKRLSHRPLFKVAVVSVAAAMVVVVAYYWSMSSAVVLVSAFVVVVAPPRHYHAGYHNNKPITQRRLSSSLLLLYAKQQKSIKDGGDDDDDLNHRDIDDWRAFRARLVQNGLPDMSNTNNSISSNNHTSSSSSSSFFAHECTPLVEVGTILLSIPTTDLCQALEQQFWHRSVVLVTAVSKDTIHGDLEENVPEEQLAQGAGRGRWTYRGILLNRMTDLTFHGTTGEQLLKRGVDISSSSNDNDIYWQIMRGGDLAGIDSSDGHTEFMCLHTLELTDPNVDQVSTRLVGNLSMTSLTHAQDLCSSSSSQNRIHPDRFYTYGGFCSWRPGQLEREMGEGRGEWLALSVDAGSILSQIEQQQRDASASAEIIQQQQQEVPGSDAPVAHKLLQAGTVMWRNFLNMIDWSEARATERIPAGQLNFYDMMLAVWAEESLCVDNNGQDVNGDVDDDVGDGNGSAPDNCSDSNSLIIEPGTLVRSTSRVPNDVLLFDQEFIRSVILVLEETPVATIGIILNLPLSAAVECVDGESPLPLRYGGPIDAQDWRDGYINHDMSDVVNKEEEIYEGFIEYQNGLSVNDYNSVDIDDDDDGGNDSTSLYIEVDYDDDDDDNNDDDNDSSFIWLHRDASLGSRGSNGGGGMPLGSSGLWMINEEDALSALQIGKLSKDDTMVFSGVCIWEKAHDLGKFQGGLREMILGLESLEIVQGRTDEGGGKERSEVNTVWDILSQGQEVLVKESLDSNMAAAIDAWTAACSHEVDSPRRIVAKSTPPTFEHHELSDAALRAWIGVNLLGDPLGTLVEVKSAHQK